MDNKPRTTVYNISPEQVLKLKQLALKLLGVASLSALIRAIAEGKLEVRKSEDWSD